MPTDIKSLVMPPGSFAALLSTPNMKRLLADAANSPERMERANLTEQSPTSRSQSIPRVVRRTAKTYEERDAENRVKIRQTLGCEEKENLSPKTTPRRSLSTQPPGPKTTPKRNLSSQPPGSPSLKIHRNDLQAEPDMELEVAELKDDVKFIPVKADWVPGSRAGAVLLKYDGYTYHVKKFEGGPRKLFSYNCSKKRAEACEVRLTYSKLTDEIVSVRNLPHTHDEDLHKKFVKSCLEDLISENKDNPLMKPRAVKQKLESKVATDAEFQPAVQFIPTIESISRAIGRARQRETDVNIGQFRPKCWDDCRVPESMKKTIDGRPFMALDEKLYEEVDKDERFWLFLAPWGKAMMETSTDWFIDGTFEICEKMMFSQLLVISIKDEETDSCFPVLFAFLPNKSTHAYKAILKSVLIAGVPPPNLVRCDFEKSLLSAIRQVYPRSKIMGCEIHWKRALQRKAQKFNISGFLSRNARGQYLMRVIWAMAFVPESDLIKVWDNFVGGVVDGILDDESLEEDLTGKLHSWLEYVTRTYIGELDPVTMRRKNPVVPIPVWSKFDHIMAGEEDLTNNAAENFNSVSKLCLPMVCSALQAVQSVRKEELSARTRYFSILNSNRKSKGRGLKPGTKKVNKEPEGAPATEDGTVQPGIVKVSERENTQAAESAPGHSAQSISGKSTVIRSLAGPSLLGEEDLLSDGDEDADDSTEAMNGDDGDRDGIEEVNDTDDEDGTKYERCEMTTRIRMRKRKFQKLRSMCRRFGEMPMEDYVGGVVYHYQH